MKKCFFGAIAVLALASCSNEKVVELSQDQEIKFTATAGKALSRANDGYCNKSLPANIYLSAAYTTDGSTYVQYFKNDAFKLNSGKEYISSGSVRYWPELTNANQKLKFFATTATTPGDPNPIDIAAPAWVTGNTGMTLKDYTVGTTVANQHDLLYAVTEVTSKPTDGLQEINFRHALSQIEFRAKNENTNIRVEICGVKVVNVNNKGTFTFSESTDLNIPQHDYTGADAANKGVWSALADKKTYGVTFGPVEVKAAGTELTTENDASKEYSANTMYLIPQAIVPWNKDDHAKPTDENTNTYFLVTAKIWNIAGDSWTANDVILWGSGESMKATGAKDIAIPAAAVTWAPGKRYVYTFVFTTDGNGGTDPGTGDEVLTPIRLDVTVDDFVNHTEETVDMVK